MDQRDFLSTGSGKWESGILVVWCEVSSDNIPSVRGKLQKTSVRMTGVLAKIRTEHLPSTSLEC
jgi:hypothetical protein